MAKILICTGIFPPQIGGPAQYAKETADEFRRQGHETRVLTYKLERRLPTLIRHKLFFLRAVWALIFERPDFILALDTFSVGWPAVLAAKIFGKKILIRTGGDFLWESYVERTGDLVLFKNFYQERAQNFNLKEKIIFAITRWTLQNASAVIFSTDWQRKIFELAYGLDSSKNFIVENFYGEKLPVIGSDFENFGASKSKMFVAGTRQLKSEALKWKNIGVLKVAFAEAREVDPMIEIDLKPAPYGEFLEKIRRAYAVILVSLGDISPNMILDAVRAGTPFILTRENGLFERLKDVGLFVDPENPADIKEKILFLANPANHKLVKEKLQKFSFTHSWRQICAEILAVANSVGVKERGDAGK